MRVLLATDRPGLGAALSLYLGEHDVDVVGVVARASEIGHVVAATAPQTVVVDDHLAGNIGGDIGGLVGELKRGAPGVRVVVLGSGGAAAAGEAAAGREADALAPVGDPPATLLAALERIASGAR